MTWRRTSPSWTSPGDKELRGPAQSDYRGQAAPGAPARSRCGGGSNKDDEHKPRGKNRRSKGGRYKRDFGVPKDSRIVKHAGGDCDYGYNAHTAVGETAQIVVAAELSNNAADPISHR